VIVLRFWRGLLPEAIAQQLGVPNNTVRSRLQPGLERLGVRLDAEQGDRERWSAPLLAFAGVLDSRDRRPADRDPDVRGSVDYTAGVQGLALGSGPCFLTLRFSDTIDFMIR